MFTEILNKIATAKLIQTSERTYKILKLDKLLIASAVISVRRFLLSVLQMEREKNWDFLCVLLRLLACNIS